MPEVYTYTLIYIWDRVIVLPQQHCVIEVSGAFKLVQQQFSVAWKQFVLTIILNMGYIRFWCAALQIEHPKPDVGGPENYSPVAVNRTWIHQN